MTEPKTSELRRQHAYERHVSGATYTEIVLEMGVSRERVRQLAEGQSRRNRYNELNKLHSELAALKAAAQFLLDELAACRFECEAGPVENLIAYKEVAALLEAKR